MIHGLCAQRLIQFYIVNGGNIGGILIALHVRCLQFIHIRLNDQNCVGVRSWMLLFNGEGQTLAISLHGHIWSVRHGNRIFSVCANQNLLDRQPLRNRILYNHILQIDGTVVGDSQGVVDCTAAVALYNARFGLRSGGRVRFLGNMNIKIPQGYKCTSQHCGRIIDHVHADGCSHHCAIEGLATVIGRRCIHIQDDIHALICSQDEGRSLGVRTAIHRDCSDFGRIVRHLGRPEAGVRQIEIVSVAVIFGGQRRGVVHHRVTVCRRPFRSVSNFLHRLQIHRIEAAFPIARHINILRSGLQNVIEYDILCRCVGLGDVAQAVAVLAADCHLCFCAEVRTGKTEFALFGCHQLVEAGFHHTAAGPNDVVLGKQRQLVPLVDVIVNIGKGSALPVVHIRTDRFKRITRSCILPGSEAIQHQPQVIHCHFTVCTDVFKAVFQLEGDRNAGVKLGCLIGGAE